MEKRASGMDCYLQNSKISILKNQLKKKKNSMMMRLMEELRKKELKIYLEPRNSQSI